MSEIVTKQNSVNSNLSSKFIFSLYIVLNKTQYIMQITHMPI